MADDSASESRNSGSQKRAPKPTDIAIEEKVNRLCYRRQGKLALLTRKMRDIQQMKECEDNVEIVEVELSHSFHRIFSEFKEANEEVVQHLSEVEREDDQFNWYKPKFDGFERFIFETEKWVSETRKGYNEDDVNEGIMPKDSVSATFTLSARSRHSSSTQSSVSSTRIKAKAEHAALLARAAALKKKQELDAEKLKLKAKREQTEMEAEIAASTARLEVFSQQEDTCDDMSDNHLHKNVTEEDKTDLSDSPSKKERKPVPPLLVSLLQENDACSKANASARQIPDSGYSQQLSGTEKELHQIMQRQNEVTELLIMQQSLSQLPQREVPVFSGDPLVFR